MTTWRSVCCLAFMATHVAATPVAAQRPERGNYIYCSALGLLIVRHLNTAGASQLALAYQDQTDILMLAAVSEGRSAGAPADTVLRRIEAAMLALEEATMVRERGARYLSSAFMEDCLHIVQRGERMTRERDAETRALLKPYSPPR